jgi:hypothetical protein
MMTDWGIFYGTAETYADVFGAEGLAEYRRLAESEWAKFGHLTQATKKMCDPPGAFASRE